jgi:hypothetical protein
MPFTDHDKETFLYKYIENIDHHSLENIKNTFLSGLPTVNNFFIPLQLGIKEFIGLEVTHSILIYAKPNQRSRIHMDYRADKLKLALNIPLKNCEDSITELWNCGSKEPKYSLTPSNVPYNEYEIINCRKISEFRLTKPVIFNTKIPHSVNNLSNKPRLAISLRFREDPWHLVDF